MDATPPSNLPDEFEERVGQVLSEGKAGLASRLLNLRAQFHAGAALQAHAMVAPSADELNARNQKFLEDAAKLLSNEDFFKIFGIQPGEKINLVLPDPTKT